MLGKTFMAALLCRLSDYCCILAISNLSGCKAYGSSNDVLQQWSVIYICRALIVT